LGKYYIINIKHNLLKGGVLFFCVWRNLKGGAQKNVKNCGICTNKAKLKADKPTRRSNLVTRTSGPPSPNVNS